MDALDRQMKKWNKKWPAFEIGVDIQFIESLFSNKKVGPRKKKKEFMAACDRIRKHSKRLERRIRKLEKE